MARNPMKIRSLTFNDFRNYNQLALDDLGQLTIFIGHNAVGKTNILEGVQLLTSASSFRHPQISQLIKEGKRASRIVMQAGDGNRDIEVALLLEPGKKRYTVNGKQKGAADVRGIMPSVIFTPDDLELAKKSSSVKRAALDDLGVQLTRNYYVVRRDYEKTVRYKNRLLKEEASTALVESINETLLTCGVQLYCYRRALFARMVPHVSRAYGELSGGSEEFTATYRASWDRENDVLAEKGISESASRDEVRSIMSENLRSFFDEERRRHRCVIGPHNDEVVFALAGRDAASFASQGQQRSIVLSWKLAEVKMVREVLGISPVLLLDDVLSELDEFRRETLVQFVTDEIQTFVTATDLSGFHEELLSRAQVINMEKYSEGILP